ncbi:hypothetical protein V1264_006557 [Littorina saxatilis]|uniref:Uncharacterized protein n=1 Tax=Littorina saxatilis TaxID=31220 RepID=A0AAN9AXY8_9CAEN
MRSQMPGGKSLREISDKFSHLCTTSNNEHHSRHRVSPDGCGGGRSGGGGTWRQHLPPSTLLTARELCDVMPH